MKFIEMKQSNHRIHFDHQKHFDGDKVSQIKSFRYYQYRQIF